MTETFKSSCENWPYCAFIFHQLNLNGTAISLSQDVKVVPRHSLAPLWFTVSFHCQLILEYVIKNVN